MKSPIQSLPLPELYYDGHSSAYWRENASGGWQKINETSLKTELISKGYCPEESGGSYLSEVEVAKRDIQLHQDILFAGPVAGYDAGHHEICSQSILVTQSPRVIEPKQGEWPLIRAVVDGLLKSDDLDQTPYLFGWLKMTAQSVRERKWMPGQVLALAGPRESGKSLIQALITEITGGRAAKPYQYMTGGTTFNAEHFGAEHLMIEDESASTDIRARRNLGTAMKGITVNEMQRCHPKGRTPIMLTPLWRLTISVNEEPENLMVMPPMEDGITDKIIFLKAFRCKMPMPTNTPDQRTAFFAALRAELPAFLYFLAQWEIPEQLRNERMGICAYQNPELLEALNDIQPELQLLAIIDQCLLTDYTSWTGTAEKLEKQLTDHDAAFNHKAKKLLYFSSACGTYLGRLAKAYPERVSSKKIHGTTLWTVEGADDEGNNPF